MPQKKLGSISSPMQPKQPGLAKPLHICTHGVHHLETEHNAKHLHSHCRTASGRPLFGPATHPAKMPTNYVVLYSYTRDSV